MITVSFLDNSLNVMTSLKFEDNKMVPNIAFYCFNSASVQFPIMISIEKSVTSISNSITIKFDMEVTFLNF